MSEKKPRNCGKPWCECDVETAVNMSLSGRTTKEIANFLRRSYGGTRCLLNHRKIKRACTRQDLVDDLMKPHSVHYLAGKYNMDVRCIYNWRYRLKQQGVALGSIIRPVRQDCAAGGAV